MDCPLEGHILEPDGERLQLITDKGKTYILMMDDLLTELFVASHPVIGEEQAKYEKFLINLPKIQAIAKKNKKLRGLI